MGRIGNGFGSEWQLMWYLARHRDELNDHVRRVTGGERVEWVDFPTSQAGAARRDAEWKGLDFISDASTQEAWRRLWPHGSGIQNWDAVGRIVVADRHEWLLVEAKAHRAEIQSDCGAKEDGGLMQIRRALDATKAALGVDAARDWERGYYQFCNRVAVLQFLESNGIPARLLFIYFTGHANPRRECPVDGDGWTSALSAQDDHVGLPSGHPLEERMHKLFLPAFSRPEKRRARTPRQVQPDAGRSGTPTLGWKRQERAVKVRATP